MRRWRRIMRRGRVWFLRVLRMDDSSSRLALGAAVGIFVAMTPTIGLQMALVLLILLVVPGNKLVGLPMVWVTNPATAVPIYTFNYWLGAHLTGQTPLHNIAGQWRSVVNKTPGLGGLFTSPGEWFANFGNWLGLLWGAMKDVMVPLWVGSIVTAIVAGVAAYVIFYYLIEFYRGKLRLFKEHLARHIAARRLAARDEAIAAAAQAAEAEATAEAAGDGGEADAKGGGAEDAPAASDEHDVHNSRR